jgi:hypothetical protein
MLVYYRFHVLIKTVVTERSIFDVLIGYNIYVYLKQPPTINSLKDDFSVCHQNIYLYYYFYLEMEKSGRD